MNAATPGPVRSGPVRSGPVRIGPARTGAVRIGYEVRSYFRAPDSVFFTFLFPIIMLALFSVAFDSAPDIQAGPGVSVDYATYYLPGLVATAFLLSGTQSLGVDIAGERSDGTLKRLGGTPLPVLAYFVGKVGMVLVTVIAQVALLLGIAAIVFGVQLPADGGAWARFAGIMLLGVATSCVLGIAISALPREGRRATATIVPIVLVLQFISACTSPSRSSPLVADRRRGLPPPLDGVGHAVGVPPRGLRVRRTRGRLAPRDRYRRPDSVARPRRPRVPADVSVEPTGCLTFLWRDPSATATGGMLSTWTAAARTPTGASTSPSV